MNGKSIVLPGLAVLLSACGGGSSNVAPPEAMGGRTAITNILRNVQASTCPSGGSKIETGIDLDLNGVLDLNEVSETSFVCNGADGATGAILSRGSAGATGIAGTRGVGADLTPPQISTTAPSIASSYETNFTTNISDDVGLASASLSNSSGFSVLPVGVKSYQVNDLATIPLGTTYSETFFVVDTSDNFSAFPITIKTPESAIRQGEYSIVGYYALPAGFDCVQSRPEFGNGLIVNSAKMDDGGKPQWSIAKGFNLSLYVRMTRGGYGPAIALRLTASNVPLSATSYNGRGQGGKGTGPGYGYVYDFTGSVAKSKTIPANLDVTIQMLCTNTRLEFVDSVGTVAAFSLQPAP